MKLSNFQLTRTAYPDNCLKTVYHGTVDVETGFWKWKKKVTKDVWRIVAGYWIFVEDGKYVDDDILALARSWTAKTGDKT